MSVICYMSVICLVLGGVVGLGYILSVWVLGVGMSTLDAQTAVRRVSGAPSIGMFRPIRVDHTNCLQRTIKTLGILVDSEIVLSTRYGKTMVFINKNLINRDHLSTCQQRPLINKVDSW